MSDYRLKFEELGESGDTFGDLKPGDIFRCPHYDDEDIYFKIDRDGLNAVCLNDGCCETIFDSCEVFPVNCKLVFRKDS